MANRPVYVPMNQAPYYKAIDIEFVYNRGLNIKQKQKNILAIHEIFMQRYPEKSILEISSKSLQPLGVLLSAFNLKKYVPSIQKSIPVENIYQGGKVFEQGGPFVDLYQTTAKQSKKEERLRTSGRLISYYYENEFLPLNPIETFYNWLYINALMENQELAEQILEYNAFTDIEFNPRTAINCQAKAAAIYIALHNLGLLDRVKDYHEFRTLFGKMEEKELKKACHGIMAG